MIIVTGVSSIVEAIILNILISSLGLEEEQNASGLPLSHFAAVVVQVIIDMLVLLYMYMLN